MSYPYPLPIELGGELAAQVGVTADLSNRLATYLKQKTNVNGILLAVDNQIADLKAALTQLKSDRYLANAFGAGLDTIGAIVGRARNGYSDTLYRRQIAGTILLNMTSGTLPEIYAILTAVKPAGSVLTILDGWPAGFTCHMETVPMTDDDVMILISFLRLAKVAGVRAILEWSPVTLSNTFRFDVGPGFDVGHLAGAII